MKSLRNLPLQPRRDAWLEINLDAVEHNARAIRKLIPKQVKLMAIVKADAYGHGAAMVLPTLEASGVSLAGVASIDEAIQLRQAGIKLPVLVIGAVPDWAMQYAAAYDIQLTIFHPNHLENLRKAYQQAKKPFKVHIKVDTGMHRIGLPCEQAADFIQHCQKQSFIRVEGIFSHLADSLNDEPTAAQRACWETLCAQIDPLPRYVHISNSGHALMPDAFPENSALNLARLGIAFWGYGNHPRQTELVLKPVMSLKARIMHIQDVPPDTGVSYCATYRTPKDAPRRIATVPVGYADGVSRSLSNRIHGHLAGKWVPQVGTITMDQMMFDITDVPGAMMGDTLTLIGTGENGQAIWLDDWAAKTGTIEYELMCALRVRLPKTYTR